MEKEVSVAREFKGKEGNFNSCWMGGKLLPCLFTSAISFLPIGKFETVEYQLVRYVVLTPNTSISFIGFLSHEEFPIELWKMAW